MCTYYIHRGLPCIGCLLAGKSCRSAVKRKSNACWEALMAFMNAIVCGLFFCSEHHVLARVIFELVLYYCLIVMGGSTG